MATYSQEEEEALLRKELRERKEGVQETERKLEQLLLSSEADAQRNQSLFHLHVITNGVPEVINPRDTVGAFLIGQTWSDLCFQVMYKDKVLGAFVYFITAVCPPLFWVLSISVDPTFGWAAGLCIPFAMMSFSLYNRALLYRVVTSFNWWVIFVLLGISMGTMIDAFAYDPPRTFGTCCLLSAYVIASMADARPLLKNPSELAKNLFLSWACLLWAGILLWWLNKWIMIRETVIPLGSTTTVNVQSIGFSCFSSVAVLFSRYALVGMRDHTGNTMVMIKTRVRYRPSKSPPPRNAEDEKVVPSEGQLMNASQEFMRSPV